MSHIPLPTTWPSNVSQLTHSASHSYATWLLGSLLLLICFQNLVYPKRNPRRLPHPPGPPRYPIIGNALNIPLKFQWKVFSQWSKLYGDYRRFSVSRGDMIYMEILNQPVLVLNSVRRIEDLLEKRSALYSDRPTAPMLRELMGWKNLFVCMDQGPRWRLHRKTFVQHFAASIVHKYRPLHLDTIDRLIHRLSLSPDNVVHEVHLHATSLVARLMYGIDITKDTTYTHLIDSIVASFEQAATPGRFLVDIFPSLQYIPAWMPGAYFRRFGEGARELLDRLQEHPFRLVEERMAQGKADPCVASDMIERLPPLSDPTRGDTEEMFRQVASTAHIAGGDTSFSAMRTFLYAMSTHPDIQRKAQQEIDREVDAGRLPIFEDRDRLPYVNALVREVLRWVTVVPFAFPHVLSQDDEYDGYFIPKGTLVLPNSWAVQHDSQAYDNPFNFDPDRFFESSGNTGTKFVQPLDPGVSAAFGYGRRICPGIYFATDTLYIFCASMLAAYDVLPDSSLEGHGENLSLLDGLLSGVESFKCSVRPRAGRSRI
ncbi:cytochrome P450 [Coprinopsis marcescibilis]|uniref:Cytochrome P450 n=1 Tax=Coprinopsis marcescibilis TaxID=230819 RepID=A0A5C3L5U4_COPMA|nr:cytochrome P450 [Coprinopsis marcescibilis]